VDRVKQLLGVMLFFATGVVLAGADKPAPAFPSVETRDLHNAYRLSGTLVSGAAPENEQAFKDLQALGVKTIISVDGAKPDADTARRYGMRYVHLPIGYDGVEAEEGKPIAKALTELPGPVYVHCHHGKHRSAAAVAVACVMNGTLNPEQAESVLQTFGTGENYLGLWRDAREAKPLDAKELEAVKVDYVERAAIPELAERMVAVDKHWEHLKSLQQNEWKPLAGHPDLDPAHEALQLEEHLRESARTDDTAKRPDDYRKVLSSAESSAAKLREELAAKPLDSKSASAAAKELGASCTACHKAHRD
jgi:protein tyrosine phosphatase (PTP) superfamily phosphohydrolase (DUF442 family)